MQLFTWVFGYLYFHLKLSTHLRRLTRPKSCLLSFCQSSLKHSISAASKEEKSQPLLRALCLENLKSQILKPSSQHLC